MKRIFKYHLPPVGHVGLGAHGDPRPLSLGWQGGQLVMWMEVDVDAPAKVHGFEVVLTGHVVPIDDHADAVYVGTAQLVADDGEPYVVHVYRWVPRQ